MKLDKQKIAEVEAKLDGKTPKLTLGQIELGAQYLAMSNICALDHFRKDIKDLPTMRQAVNRAWDTAVTGYMESQDGGYDDKHESAAIRDVEAEVRGFRKELKAGGETIKSYIATLRKEVPFFFTDPSISTHIKVTARKYEGDDMYSWAVFRSDRPTPCYIGLGKSEVSHYKKLVEKYIINEQSR
jgi:hypothetical protein